MPDRRDRLRLMTGDAGSRFDNRALRVMLKT